jgi:hypothetical protein
LERVAGSEITTRRTEQDTQDLGTTIIATLGTASVVSFTTALGVWLKLHRSIKITIKVGQDEFIGENLTSKDTERLEELFAAYVKNEKK